MDEQRAANVTCGELPPRWEMEGFFPWSRADAVRGHEVSHFPVDELIEFLRGSRNAGLHLFVNTTWNNGFRR